MKPSRIRHLVLFALLLSIASAGCTPGVAGDAGTRAATPPPTEVESPGTWEIVLQKPIEQPMRVAAFLDGDFGITGGASDPGRVHYTTDGGETWTMAESSAA